ncbi:MAG: CCDC90 family protein [Methylococcaceae bacterium]|nr:CCDC90 family protein [Methylococcaceae bacterium]
MTAIAFDTLKFAKRLKEAGFTEQQAEALAVAEAEFIVDNVATKRDLEELEVALKRDIKELEVALKRDIKELDVALKRDIKDLDVALKRDIKDLEVALKRDIKELETKMAHDMRDLEYRLIIKLGAMLVVTTGLMATLAKLL